MSEMARGICIARSRHCEFAWRQRRRDHATPLRNIPAATPQSTSTSTISYDKWASISSDSEDDDVVIPQDGRGDVTALEQSVSADTCSTRHSTTLLGLDHAQLFVQHCAAARMLVAEAEAGSSRGDGIRIFFQSLDAMLHELYLEKSQGITQSKHHQTLPQLLEIMEKVRLPSYCPDGILLRCQEAVQNPRADVVYGHVLHGRVVCVLRTA